MRLETCSDFQLRVLAILEDDFEFTKEEIYAITAMSGGYPPSSPAIDFDIWQNFKYDDEKRDKRREYMKRFKEKHPNYSKERHKKWVENNPEKVKEYCRRRREKRQLIKQGREDEDNIS